MASTMELATCLPRCPTFQCGPPSPPQHIVKIVFLVASCPRRAGVLDNYRASCSVRRGLKCFASSNEGFVKSPTGIPFGGLHPNIDDEEWQRERRKESEELQRKRELEAEEEVVKTENYREMSKRLESFAEEDVKEAKALVASFIKAGEEIEERIIEAADNGKLTMLVLLVIQNRLELARHDDERHVVQALDLLFRRIEAEMMRREASPAIQFLDELLYLHDGSSHDEWIRKCRQSMIKTFPPEDAFTFLAPQGFDLQSHQGPIDMPKEDDVLLRADFIREVDAFLAEIMEAQSKSEPVEGLDPLSVAIRLSQQQKDDAVQQVRDLRKLAIELKW